MKSSKLILALWLGASAWAQTPPQKPQVNPPLTGKQLAAPQDSKEPGGNDPAKQVAAPAEPVVGVRKPVKRRPAKSMERTYAGRKMRHSAAKAAVSLDGRAVPVSTRGRRDPFVSPVVERVRNAATCTGSGKQCLLVGELSLHGVVRSPEGFIAVVMNGERTYFLREHDPLSDGVVERITKDTIILRERSSDVLGRPLTREVTKKL